MYSKVIDVSADNNIKVEVSGVVASETGFNFIDLTVADYADVYDFLGTSRLSVEEATKLSEALGEAIKEAVKKEKLYNVVFIKLSNQGYLNVNREDGVLHVGSPNETYNYQTEFTEAEIKKIDKRFWDFAEPV